MGHLLLWLGVKRSILSTIRSIADYFAAWSEQDGTGSVAIVDNIAVPGEGILDSNQYPGVEGVDNPGNPFTFTGDNPDDWLGVVDDANREIGEVAQGQLHANIGTPGGGYLNMWRSGGASTSTMTQAGKFSIGLRYRVVTIVDGVGSGRIRVQDSGGGNRKDIDAPGTYVTEETAIGTSLQCFTIIDPTDLTIKSISATLANPFNGGHTGVAVGQPGQYRIGKVATYSGTSYTEKALAAVSEYDAVYNPTNFTRAVVMRKTTYDTTERWLFQDYVDANNFVGIRDTTTAGTIQFVYKSGGTENVVTWVSGSPTDSKLLDLSVSGGVLEGRVNGVSVGTNAIVGVFTGAFTVFMLGAANDTTGGHLGDLAWDQHFTAKTTDADMVRITNSMGIPA